MRIHRSIKVRLTFVTIAFTLLITLTLVGLSLFQFQRSARTNLLQSIEFNLHLTAELIQSDIQNLDRLRLAASIAPQTINYLLAEEYASLGTALHTQFTEYMAQNPSVRHLRRLVVTDAYLSRRVQVGIFMDRIPVMPHVLYMFGDFCEYNVPQWSGITNDPFAVSGSEPIIYMISPIRHGRAPQAIGYTYIAISTNAILAPLSGYPFLAQGSLYLTIGDMSYYIDDGRFYEVALSFNNARPGGNAPLNATTEIISFNGTGGGRYMAVSTPIGTTGLILTQTFPTGLVLDEIFLMARVLLFVCIGVLILGFIIGRSVNQMARETEILMEARLESEKKKHELEYKILQNQINPHFLYNTLNSIKWMASIQNATGIVEMTVSLSRLLMSVAKINKTSVPLARELGLLEDYFVISRYRFGNSITTEINVSEEFLENPIPIFTLQPIAENAIIHGIAASDRAGTIVIEARKAGPGILEITIEDNGIGMDEDTIRGLFENAEDNQGLFKKVGIGNVHARLQYEFGVEYGIRVESEVEEFTRVTVRIPSETNSK